jgi:8-amino-7-oxononanoate synthase
MDLQTLLAQKLSDLEARKQYRELETSVGISFTDNDYLGLSLREEIQQAGSRTAAIFGAGARGSRLLGGHNPGFQEVEAKIADFFGAPDALLFSSGYLANLAVTTSLAECFDLIVSDERNHASLIDGIRLSGKPKRRLPHQQWDQAPREGKILAVAEALYSMDGDLLDAPALSRFLAGTESFLILDEAHSAGVFREDGRGWSAPWRNWDRMAMVVTFGKAFGVGGAAVLGSPSLKKWLVNRARSFLYSTAPPPFIAGAILKSLEIVDREEWRREELWDRARMVRRILRDAPGQEGLECEGWAGASPIIPFQVPGEVNALRFCENMRKLGIYLRAIRYPTVALGAERIRLSLNLSVSRENTETMAKEMVKAWKAFLS